jgi:hypothetical protein
LITLTTLRAGEKQSKDEELEPVPLKKGQVYTLRHQENKDRRMEYEVIDTYMKDGERRFVISGKYMEGDKVRSSTLEYYTIKSDGAYNTEVKGKAINGLTYKVSFTPPTCTRKRRSKQVQTWEWKGKASFVFPDQKREVDQATSFRQEAVKVIYNGKEVDATLVTSTSMRETIKDTTKIWSLVGAGIIKYESPELGTFVIVNSDDSAK